MRNPLLLILTSVYILGLFVVIALAFFTEMEITDRHGRQPSPRTKWIALFLLYGFWFIFFPRAIWDLLHRDGKGR